MYKIIKIFIFILILSNFFAKISYADENIACKENKEKKIVKIIVEINNYKSWTKNNIKILIGNTRNIPSKLKKGIKEK